MRVAIILLFLLLPGYFFGQGFYSIGETVPSSTQLMSVGGRIVMIQPIDLTNKEQKWVCLNLNLSEVSIKKLITPNAEQMVSQVYIPSVNSIIRLDQYVTEGQIFLNAFAFDATGNMKKQLQLEPIINLGQQLYPMPFYLIQSENKEWISVTQSVNLENDSLQLRNILLDKDLNIISNSVFNIDYNNDLFDYYLPVLNEDGSVFFITAEKYTSYRLSTQINCYYNQKGSDQLKPIRFEVSRKKLKKIDFSARNNTFTFLSLFSAGTEKAEIAGYVYGGFNIGTNEYLKPIEVAYSEQSQEKLRKAFWADRRKDNFLNYLSLLPLADSAYEIGYGYILPKEEFARIDNSKTYDNPTNDIGKFQQKAAYTSSLVGSKPAGYSKPLNAAEAMDYAARQEAARSANKGDMSREKERNPRPSIDQYQRNLILFSAAGTKEANTTKLYKIKSSVSPEYQFFTYYPAKEGYAALYYTAPAFGLPYLSCITMNKNGVVTEKKVFDESSKILLKDYPFIIQGNEFTGFCEDKETGLIGLVKFNLR
jgi:hypothetical protein